MGLMQSGLQPCSEVTLVAPGQRCIFLNQLDPPMLSQALLGLWIIPLRLHQGGTWTPNASPFQRRGEHVE